MMRWLIAILLTANVLLVLWLGLGHDTGDVPRPQPAPDVGELRLVGEPQTRDSPLPAAPATPVVEAAIPEEQPAPAIQAEMSEPAPVGATDEAPARPPTGEEADSGALAAGEDNAPEEATAITTSRPEPLPPVATVPEPEVPPQEAAVAGEAAAEPAPAPKPPAIARACWRLGPFESEEQAQGLAGRLPAGVESVEIRQVLSAVPSGYFVLIPTFPDREQALEVVRQLKEKGIQDSWVFVSGPLRNAISLGMFSREENAKRRQRAIAAKGFIAEIQPRQSEVEQIMMLVRGPDTGAVERLLKQLTANQLERTACP
jgi:hypothetical protein